MKKETKELKTYLIERFKDESLSLAARKTVGKELARLGVRVVSIAQPNSGSCSYYLTN
jgi:hypothetical protein